MIKYITRHRTSNIGHRASVMGDNEGAVTTVTNTTILLSGKIVTDFGKEKENESKKRGVHPVRCFELVSRRRCITYHPSEWIKSPYDDNKSNDHILKLIERILPKGHISINNGRQIRWRWSIHDPCITIITLQRRGDDGNKDGRCRQHVKTTPLYYYYRRG